MPYNHNVIKKIIIISHINMISKTNKKNSYQDQPLSCTITSSPYLWFPPCPNNSKDFPSWNYSCLSSIPINVLVLQISGQEPQSGWYTSVIEFRSVAATYILPTHLMNNEWAPYATYSSPTSLIWPGFHQSQQCNHQSYKVPLHDI